MTKDKFKGAVANLMLKNRRFCSGHQYTVPSPDSYPYQWFWDSCFHAIIFTYFNLNDAKVELLSLVSHQFENGMIPHMIYWDKAKKTDFPVIEWGKKDTSIITQPPMLAYAVWKIYQTDKDAKFLEKIYSNLSLFYNYLINERDPRNNHLIGIINPDESGEDNSPRFDVPLGLDPKHNKEINFGKRLELIGKHRACNFEVGICMKNFFWVKDVPFNAIMVENLNILSDIAKALGNTADAKYFKKQAELITSAMRKFMLEDGIFWSTYGSDYNGSFRYKKIKVLTWAIFSPLFARICTKDEARIVVEKYLLDSKRFKTKYPVPTVSLDEPSYDSSGFWRGPVWMATNWFIFKGLLNYGYQDIAEEIAESSLNLWGKSGFREQYGPQTGEGLGAKDFTWGGLVLDMN